MDTIRENSFLMIKKVILFNILSVYSLSFSTSPKRIIVSEDTRTFPLTTILLTNSLNMKKLNKKFRKRNKSTDVLSFPSFSSKSLKTIKDKKEQLKKVESPIDSLN